MDAIKTIVLDFQKLKTGQKTSFRIKPQTTLYLKIRGSFTDKHLYEHSVYLILEGDKSSVDLQGKFFVGDSSQLKLHFFVKDTNKTKAARINLDLKGLLFDRSSQAIIEQNISLSHKDSLLHHSLAFGSPNPDILNYLASRGVGIEWFKSYLSSNYATI